VNWSLRRWKLGLMVACSTGFFTGILGWGLGLSLKGALIMLAGAVGKDFVLFVTNHPVDSISFDTETKTKDQTNEK
jgi:hypothetical protein